MTNNPVTVLVTFRIKKGSEKEFEGVLLPHLRRVAAETTCEEMTVYRDPEDPTRYMLYERWADRDEFLGVQMKRPYRIPYNEAVEPLEAEPRSVTFWEEIPLEVKLGGLPSR